MALKDTWIDLQDAVQGDEDSGDEISVKPINEIAHAVIENENDIKDLKEVKSTTGKGAPTETTKGAVGCLYMDTDTGDLYKCTNAENGVYTWELVGGNSNESEEEEVIEYDYNHLTLDSEETDTANVTIQSEAEEVKLWHSGVNMLPKFENKTLAGVTFTVDNDGVVTINGTVNYSKDLLTSAMLTAYFDNSIGYVFMPANITGTRYILSAWCDPLQQESGDIIFRVRNQSNQNVLSNNTVSMDSNGYISNKNMLFADTTTELKSIDIYFNSIPNGTVFNNWKCKVQLERAEDTVGEYYPPSLTMHTLPVVDGKATKEIALNEGKNYLVTNADNMKTTIKIAKTDNRPMESYYGKRWACFGDSITYKAEGATDKRYYEFVAKDLGLTTINYGRPTTGYYEDGNYPSTGQYYKRMENIDPDSFDVLTIMGSTNDYGSMSRGEIQLGTYTDTGTETVCGCINTTIDKFYELAPLKRLGIITMTPHRLYGPNLSNTTIAENYVNELIKICKNRGIPYLDLYHGSGLRPWDDDFNNAYYQPNDEGTGGDGLHLNTEGAKFIAPKIREFIKSLI